MQSLGRSTSAGISVNSFADFEKFVKVLRRLRSDLLGRSPAKFANLPCHLFNEGGLIALPAMWDRRQIGRIRFDQHAVERDDPAGLADILRLGKAYVSGK